MKKYFILYLLVLVFALRFYKAGEFFFWNVDEDLLANTIKRIVVDFHPQLIGFPIPGGIYLGPAIYYILSVPYLIARMDPLVLPLISAAIGVFTTYLVYKVGKTIFEKELIGIFAAIIFGFSYLVNVYGRVLTGLTFAPILALLTYLLLYKTVKFKSAKNLVLLGILLIFATQNEGTSLSLLLLCFFIWQMYQLRISLKQLVVFVALLLISNLSLLIFDLRHNFFLTYSFLNFFSRGSSSVISKIDPGSFVDVLMIFPNTLSRMILISGDKNIPSQIMPCVDLVSKRLMGINPFIFIIVVFIFGVFLLSKSKRSQIGKMIILAHLLIIALGIFIFNVLANGYLYEWMMVIFFPGLAFISAYALETLLRKGAVGKILVLVSLGAFLIVNVYSLVSTNGHFGLKSKVDAVKWANSKIGDQPFSLDSIGSCHSQGFLYLFRYFSHMPSVVNGLIYDSSVVALDNKEPTIGVVIVSPSNEERDDFWEKYKYYKSQATESKTLDKIEVLIVPAASLKRD